MSVLNKTVDNTVILNLKRLLLLRSIAIICELLVLAVAVRVLDIDLPVIAMLVVIALHAVINILAWARSIFSNGGG